jgi:glycyl-tRNA synthetase beta chain
MTTKNLLVELFVEELPPKALKKLGEAFALTWPTFEKCRFIRLTAAVTAFASPRRLAAHVTDVAAVAADKPVVQKLMPVAVGLDAAGNATPALLKKLAALGLMPASPACAAKTTARPTSCSTTAWPRAPHWRKACKGAGSRTRRAADSQGHDLPAAGRLEQCQFRSPGAWPRCLHGAEVVPIGLLGLTSGRETHGHRFEAAVDPVVLPMPTNTPPSWPATAP